MGTVRPGRTVRIGLGTGPGVWGRANLGKDGRFKVPLRVSHHIERCLISWGGLNGHNKKGKTDRSLFGHFEHSSLRDKVYEWHQHIQEKFRHVSIAWWWHAQGEYQVLDRWAMRSMAAGFTWQ